MTRAVIAAAAPAIRLRRIDLGQRGGDDAIVALARRSSVPDPEVRDGAARIVAEVRAGGDAAVRAANQRFGGGLADGSLLIAGNALQEAASRLPADVRRALDQAIANVERFAANQLPETKRTTIIDGIEIERRWVPLDRVGCYVPGGSAPYPSSLVMAVVPARVAGVRSIAVASPADRAGTVDPIVLGAAGLLGVEELMVAGGAQAIGALAYGLPNVGLRPVDRIVGPGNSWVTAAKIEVSAEVAIDMPAGPSEGMVLADESADPVLVAADLVTQAEHGPDSPAILVTTSRALADRVESEIDALLPLLERREILARSLADHGAIVLAPDLDRALAVVNAYAPEHLSIDVADLERAVAAVRHAGSVFVGPWAPESAGDYATGANHILPTGGLARACGPLGVEGFGHYVQIQRITPGGLAQIRRSVATLADAEGLGAHRHAIEARFRDAPDAPAETTAIDAALSMEGAR